VRVLINAVSARMGGAATHLPSFLRGIGALRPDDAFVAYVGAQWTAIPGLPANVRLERAAVPPGAVSLLRWHLRAVPGIIRRERPDVLVSLLNFGPLHPDVPHVLFERNPLYFCRYHLDTLRGAAAMRRAAERRLLDATMRAADRIVTPTAAMRQMIRAFHPRVEKEKFRVVHHGFGAEAFFTGEPLPASVAERMARARGLRLLYATHAASHKGIEQLLDAARLLRDRGGAFTLWLTVDRADWPEGVARYEAFIRRHGLEDAVVSLGRIPHRAIHALYAGAQIFVFPSLCESFGFPMVEAMGSGLPVIAADTPVNREICGQAAEYYPPLDTAALANRIARLAADEASRRRLADAARSRAAAFSWDRHVREAWDVVAELGRNVTA
jgi:glycosyltransferase involved in cell wall biosynthesis